MPGELTTGANPHARVGTVGPRRSRNAVPAPAPLAALWQSLAGAPPSPQQLFVRFERGGQLGSRARRVAVLVSWGTQSVRTGSARALVQLGEVQARALRRDCVAYGLRFVDNAGLDIR